MIDKKKVKIEKAEPEVKAEAGRYFYAVGKRKTAIAQVRIYPTDTPADTLVNDKKLELYFSVQRFADTVKSALTSVGLSEKFNITVKVTGGGINAQAEAIRLGISRALIKFDESLRKVLKAEGFLTRDARVVERKKPGLKKARKSPQWAKR
ncbi:MAG: 30S ribosomal protein S9 [Candidatus Moraniibacteriota bacterium]